MLSETIKFSQLCTLLEGISSQTKKDTKKQKLEKLFGDWLNEDKDVYPLMRLIVPKLDKEREYYGMKESKIADIYIDLLALSKKSSDAVSLKQWAKSSRKNVTDFADVAFQVIKDRSTVDKSSLTIKEVNGILDSLYIAAEKRDVFSDIISKMTPLEQKWLIRIIIKEVKLGLGELTILKQFHPDASDFYNVTTDLKQVCVELKDKSIRRESNDIVLFSPFKPMLAEREHISCIVDAMDDDFVIEEKLDGERIQIHKNGDEYRYFSRNGTDYTYLYGIDNTRGALTSDIHDLFSDIVRNAILDGEMMAYDPISREFLPFGTLKTAALQDTGDPTQPRVCFFDIVYLNDRVLINRSLRERTSVLPKILIQKPGVMTIISQKAAKSTLDIVKALEEAIEQSKEGIMIKSLSSPYKIGKRADEWLKLKAEYLGSISDTLDVLIVGGYYKVGLHRTSGKIASFLCAVRVPTDGDRPDFYSFCKCSSGFSLDLLSELNEKLDPHFKPFDKSSIPTWLKLSTEKPDCVIDPDRSVVIEMSAAEIISSSQYKAGYTLRFPRFVKIRYDKDWKECMQLDEVIKLAELSKGRLQIGKIHEADLIQPSPKKKPRTRKPTYFLPSRFEGADLSQTETKDTLFEGLCVCIYSGFKSLTKQELELKFVEFGGECVQNPDDETWAVFSGKSNTIRVKNAMKSRKFNVMHSEWIVDSIKERMLKTDDRYYFYRKPENPDKDMIDSLNFDHILSEKEMMKIEKKYFPDSPNVHRNLVFDVDTDSAKTELEKRKLEFAAQILIFRGATRKSGKRSVSLSFDKTGNSISPDKIICELK